MKVKKIVALLAGLASASLVTSALAQDTGSRRETVGVDIHYESVEGDSGWSGELSYARLFMNKLELGGAYTFRGANHGGQKFQSLQIIGRQWFGTYAKADAVTPFVQISGGFDFADSRYENFIGVGGGIGVFVSNQSELRFTLKGEWGGFVDSTRFDAGYYYHF